MTGFARVDGAHAGRSWVWELKSVNGRTFEPRLRLPAGFDRLEPALRKAASLRIARGNVSASLAFVSAPGDGVLRINETVLAEALRLIDNIGGRIACEKPRPEGILALRGVVESEEAGLDSESSTELDAAILSTFSKALEALQRMRSMEGAALAKVLRAQIDEIADLSRRARSHADAQPAAIRDRVRSQLDELLSEGAVPADRLAQEAALIALKADIREELDRLDAHVEAAREWLAGSEPAGRRLDFLGQECNREANTLCSKAQDISLKRLGLDLKSVVDQFREQAQNVE